MKFWMGVTDNTWFDFLSQQNLNEINFWQPSALPLFKSADLTGMPFLFKLKRPHHHIAGGGFYVGYSTMPIDLAWDMFGVGNGAATYQDFLHLIDPKGKIRRNGGLIGCTVLSSPFFMPQDSWLNSPPNFSSNIVRGKHYDATEQDGAKIWRFVSQYLSVPKTSVLIDQSSATISEIRTSTQKYGGQTLIKPRLGQGSFRMMLTKAYQGRCAITGENTLEVLEAAHIVPYSQHGTHELNNGLLLRADFHKLFDKGLVSITPDYKIQVSPRIRETYFNGKSYYRLDGQQLRALPVQIEQQPDRDKLDFHFRNIYQK